MCLHFLRLTDNPVFSCSGQTIYEKHKLQSVLKLFKSWIQPDLLKRNSCLCDFHLHHADSRMRYRSAGGRRLAVSALGESKAQRESGGHTRV